MKKLTWSVLLVFSIFLLPAFVAAEETSSQIIVAPNTNIQSLPQYQSIQNKIVSNPDIMADIQKMAEDPEIMNLINDPAFMAAVQSGNVNALQNDPRLQRLANNPHIQSLMQKLGQ